MRPRIFFRDGWWNVQYGYFPRSMWLYGADAEQRRKITEECVHTERIIGGLPEAFSWLKTLWLRRELRLPAKGYRAW